MSGPTLARPEPSEYSRAVANYIGMVPEGDLLSILAAQPGDLVRLVGTLSEKESLLRHPPYTWTIKQVVGHMTDCERVFGYRTMRLSRNDATALPGFDENAYMLSIDFDRCPLGDLVSEFELLRGSHVVMLRHLDADAWLRAAVVNGHPMTARAVACVMAGHAEHHLRILRKRLGG
jgi:hypothetical protein